MKNKSTSILPQYSKTKLFRIFRVPCRQQKLKLVAKSIKTIKNIIIISIFIFIYGTPNSLGQPKRSLVNCAVSTMLLY